MKKRTIAITLLLLSLFLLTACKSQVAGGDKPIDTATALKMVQTGTQGVEINLVPNYPPPLIYDQNELVTLVEVKNKGNYDLGPDDCFVQITGFDPNIIRGLGLIHRCTDPGLPKLEGKSPYNIEGGFNQLEFTSSSNELPDHVFEYSPTLNILSCYHYETFANLPVCIDPLFYDVTTQQKNCLPKDVSGGGGQGAPVGVSYVGVNMVGGKAVFEINIKNFGIGRVLSPTADITQCGQSNIERMDLDRLEYDITLSGVRSGECKPLDRSVRMYNNQGKIVCTFDIQGTSAFETPLQVHLYYKYMQSYQKQIKVVKTPR